MNSFNIQMMRERVCVIMMVFGREKERRGPKGVGMGVGVIDGISSFQGSVWKIGKLKV